MKEVLYVQN